MNPCRSGNGHENAPRSSGQLQDCGWISPRHSHDQPQGPGMHAAPGAPVRVEDDIVSKSHVTGPAMRPHRPTPRRLATWAGGQIRAGSSRGIDPVIECYVMLYRGCEAYGRLGRWGPGRAAGGRGRVPETMRWRSLLTGRGPSGGTLRMQPPRSTRRRAPGQPPAGDNKPAGWGCPAAVAVASPPGQRGALGTG